MTWHSLFNMSTMEGRHLLAAYAVAFTAQGGYFGWIVWNWRLVKKRTH